MTEKKFRHRNRTETNGENIGHFLELKTIEKGLSPADLARISKVPRTTVEELIYYSRLPKKGSFSLFSIFGALDLSTDEVVAALIKFNPKRRFSTINPKSLTQDI